MQIPVKMLMHRVWQNEEVTYDDENPAITWHKFDCATNEYWESPSGRKLWECNLNDKVEIKFKHLLDIIGPLLKGLSAVDIRDRSSSQPIYAISIPEGPFLHLAVLATHFLNVTCVDTKKAPVILPLDPDEGLERLIHMISDAKPALIMHTHQKDLDRINEAIDNLNQSDSKVKYSPVVINLKTFLSEDRVHVPKDVENNTNTSDISILPKDNRISHIVYTSG